MATLGTLDGSVGVTPGVVGAVVGAPAVVGVEPGALLELLGLLVPPQAATMSATSMTMIIEKVYLEDFICCFTPYIHFCIVDTLYCLASYEAN